MMLASLLAFTLLTSAPSQGFDAGHAPIDKIARAKAPHEAGKVVDLIQSLNAYVNSHIQGESDLEHYGIEDLWVMYPADRKGDCEDYALTKLGMLEQLGVPVVTSTKLVGVIDHYRDKKGARQTEGHEILALRLPHGTVVYLDNMHSELMTRKELQRDGYQFFDWKA